MLVRAIRYKPQREGPGAGGSHLQMTAIAKGPLALNASKRSMRVACGASTEDALRTPHSTEILTDRGTARIAPA